MADVGDHGGNGLAGDGLLDGPEQLDDGFRPAENDGCRVDAVPRQPGSVGDADVLAVADELHEEDRRAVAGLHGVCRGEGKAESSTGIAPGVGEDLMDRTLGESEEALLESGAASAVPARRGCFSMVSIRARRSSSACCFERPGIEPSRLATIENKQGTTECVPESSGLF